MYKKATPEKQNKIKVDKQKMYRIGSKETEVLMHITRCIQLQWCTPKWLRE